MFCTQERGGRVACPCHPEARLVADHETGDLICPECGLVVGDRLVDAGAEWRNFDGEDNSRVGESKDPLLDLQDLGTIIGPSTGVGKDFSKYARYAGISSKEKALRAAYREMKDAAGRIHLSESVVDTACGIYKEVTDRITVKGGRKEAFAVACLYIACKQMRVPRSFKEICAISHSTRRMVAQCQQEIVKLLKIRDTAADCEKDFVERFGSALGLEEVVMKLASFIATAATEKDLFPDRGPDVVCGAAILLACVASGVAVRLTEVGQVSGATRNGLSAAYKILTGNTEIVFPPNFDPITAVTALPKADEL